MKLKTNLHLHTSEDAKEGFAIDYSIYQAIDEARKYNFKILALTSHNKFVYQEKYRQYALKKGILLIPGVELSFNSLIFRRIHVVVLNCNSTIKRVKKIDDLRKYKMDNPNIFIIAPHPNFGFINSIRLKKLIKYIDIFDAIEHSWFYSNFINFNKTTEKVAQKFKKSFIATSDTHVLKYLNSDYAIIEAERMNPKAVFKAIKQMKFINITRPKKLTVLLWHLIKLKVKYYLRLPIHKLTAQ